MNLPDGGLLPGAWQSVNAEKLFCDMSKMTSSIPARGGIISKRRKWKTYIWLSGFLLHVGGESREERTGEDPEEGELPLFLPPMRMGCGPSDSAVHESKGTDAGVVWRKPLLKCSQRGMEEENLGQCRQLSFPFHVMYLLWSFSKVGAVVFLFISWPSSQFFFLVVKGNSWWISVITDVFQHLFLFYCPFQVTVHDCSPPLPPRPWKSVRMQGWPSPSGCPISTTSSWRRSWTSRGSSTSLSATRWVARLLSLLLFTTSFLPWSLMSVFPPLLFIWPLWVRGF